LLSLNLLQYQEQNLTIISDHLCSKHHGFERGHVEQGVWKKDQADKRVIVEPASSDDPNYRRGLCMRHRCWKVFETLTDLEHHVHDEHLEPADVDKSGVPGHTKVHILSDWFGLRLEKARFLATTDAWRLLWGMNDVTTPHKRSGESIEVHSPKTKRQQPGRFSSDEDTPLSNTPSSSKPALNMAYGTPMQSISSNSLPQATTPFASSVEVPKNRFDKSRLADYGRSLDSVHTDPIYNRGSESADFLFPDRESIVETDEMAFSNWSAA
jgi:hypothetical protein